MSSVTLDMVLAEPSITDALALGFPSDLGPLALFELGSCLPDEVWDDLIEPAWQMECKSPPPLADVRAVKQAVLESLSEADEANFRNKMIAARNAKRVAAG